MATRNGVTNAPAAPLFQGKQFWLSHNIPQRNRFKELIQNNGGIIRLQEKDADIKLVDHLKRNLPSDTYSYKFVEASLAKGELRNLDDYRAGPSAPRPVGATYIPTRGHKVPYTLQDDQLLWDWMEPFERDPRASIKGNKIYQELAAQNPRHTYQSYRDRYLKRLQGRPRPGGPASSVPAPAPQEEPVTNPPVVNPPVRASRPQSRQTSPPRPTADIPKERKRKRASDHNTHGEGVAKEVSAPNLKRRTIITNNELPDPFTVRVQTGEAATTQERPQPMKATNGQQPNPNENDAGKQGGTDAQRPANESPKPSSQIDPLFRELPFLPLDDELEPDRPEQDIDAWIDERLRTGKAQNVNQIVEALKCTSMDPDVADKVLACLAAGKGIPDDLPGVWTPEDDKVVEGTDARAIKLVIEKHGSDAYNARWEYLSMARNAGLVDTQE
ncbi:hypothetical protein BO70DRAFT_317087 [Aspergillus heteromorphus CBS 117.55]|uniref:DNA-binding protein RAP1 n=1 Tax=Aspergillus heteromorphus CBS 117.55 TaxID=1448321 RepID=A0A317VZ35_9EURO|nr:uncharacterized protein BO70DRAFT_317087 [Aspergillus heteromorphus CBS 117.55]PWY78282.1 hypothetical protein BO70DRAFT_317087 [Aspergillus heteromorphus CBS 117.55]